MDRVELLLIAGGAGVILLAILIVFVRPALGGDYRRGRGEAEYQPSRSIVEGGVESGGD